MTSRDFAYWLQGFFELSGVAALTTKQTALVQKHLAMVFKHEIDPTMGSADHQAELDNLHDAGSINGGPVIRC
jgi:hypothetical protein